LDAQKLIETECDAIKKLLLEKNRLYGNSALEPIRIFSQASPIEQLDVRIDDKLKRIQNLSKKNLHDTLNEDTILDLIGYLILRRVYGKESKRRK